MGKTLEKVKQTEPLLKGVMRCRQFCTSDHLQIYQFKVLRETCKGELRRIEDGREDMKAMSSATMLGRADGAVAVRFPPGWHD